MKPITFLLLTALMMVQCSKPDPMIEINQLVEEGKTSQAKAKYKALVDKENNPNVERNYLRFLFDHKQYIDFKKESAKFLHRYPTDAEVKNLQFNYYAILATNAEQQKDFESAMDYIVTKLLSPDYADFRQWESRQSSILKKWYNHAKEKSDINEQTEVLIKMKNLGFENLARSLAPEDFEKLNVNAAN